MRSSRSLRRKNRIFGEPSDRQQDFRRKFKQYRPVKFEQDNAETERKVYGKAPRKKSIVNLTCINYEKTQSPAPTKASVSPAVERNHLVKQSEELKSFLHRIKTEESPLKPSCAINAPAPTRIRHVQQHYSHELTDSQQTLQHAKPTKYEDIINEKNKPMLKSILKEIMEEMGASHKENPRTQHIAQPSRKPTVLQQPSQPLLQGQSSPTCLAIIRDIRSQINDMFGTLNIS